MNPNTGTASLSVPIFSSPGRHGFGPQLSLSYNSGSGNGPFGFGWSLGLPAITRKTDKGLPRYLECDDADVFLISGAEDLVPILDASGKRQTLPRTLYGVSYMVHLYRPRIEGLFARLERWVAVDTGISHWRSITRENITTLYGYDEKSRLADPDDPRNIFSYLICRTFDDRGNLTLFDYIPEDGAGVDRSQAHEANRTDAVRAVQRYLKTIRYGNVQPYFPDWPAAGTEPPLPTDWHFTLALDYGDHSAQAPLPQPDQTWPIRPDPFSSYRAGFEVRTYRRCKRVLLFHDFPAEQEVGSNCLVHSTDLTYSDEQAPSDPGKAIYTSLVSVTQTGYRRQGNGYLSASLPPLELEYSQPHLQSEVLTLDAESFLNLPEGLDGSRYQWVDLDGEGVSGILTDYGGSWGYKRNLSPLNQITLPGGQRATRAQFGTLEQVLALPVPAHLGDGQQLLDLSGGGRLDLVAFADPQPGFFKHTPDSNWEPFHTFAELPRVNWSEPNLKFVDVTGDGLADVLITEDNVYTFYQSLGEDGFGKAEQVPIPWNEEKGPHVVFADGTQTIFLADMSGDGLRDIVRVRNGEVCYWPNRGYGHFGAKVAMDDAPRFPDEERFDPHRVRLADIDGSGTADLLYVGEAGVLACFNLSGNAWATPQRLAVFPGADTLSSVQVVDLLGNGTTCLVWSSPLPGVSYAPLRYVDLMGSSKPHLLVTVRNNLGAETRLAYAPSTRFYLEDQRNGQSWITRLPFPVQVVERVETYDWIGRSRFVSRYAYHHGYFDGAEREFRGFGRVEQWDTEEHQDHTLFPDVETTNEDAASFVPPVLTRTWFHTGAFVEESSISRHYEEEYWVEPGMRGDTPAAIAAREALLLPDTVLEDDLTPDEVREACRALKGSILRVEIYAEDGTLSAGNPYTVKEENFGIRRIQPFGPNQHAVFLTYSRETLNYHYERQPADPRVTHDLTLRVDDFGDILRSVSVAYGRRAGYAEPEPHLSAAFRSMLAHDQTRLHIGATEHSFTASVNQPADVTPFDAYRGPQPCEVITAELTGITPAAAHFQFAEMDAYWTSLWNGTHDLAHEDVSTPDIEGVGVPLAFARRIVEHSRVLYRHDDLSDLLPFGTVEAHTLPGESYHLALTPGLITRIFGTRVSDALLSEGGYRQFLPATEWWIPSGRVYFSPGDTDTPAQELAEACAHFYQQRRFVDPLTATTHVNYDAYDLLLTTSTDALGNVTTAANDYRVMQPYQATDPNGNRRAVAFDCLGEVAGTAVSGKAGEGDTLTGFTADLSASELQALHSDPLNNPGALLGNATSRIVHDLLAYFRTRTSPTPDAPMVYTLTRETHVSDPTPPEGLRFHHLFVYADGFGREAQHKAQAEPGPIPGVGEQVSPRWIGSGWTMYNNKGKPVRKYEPFFSQTHLFEFNRLAGVSSVLFYDPIDRLVATLHPDNTLEKTVFDAWRQETWDHNDTVLISDPRTDVDVGDFFLRLLGNAPGVFVSWYDRRVGGTWGSTPEEQAANQDAAQKSAAHAATPTVAHFDSLGRTCLNVADNGPGPGSTPQRYPTRTALDTESKPLAVFDATGRHVIEYCLREALPGGATGIRYVAGYDIAGNPLYHNGMDSGERRMLHDILGKPLQAWDARGFTFSTQYDLLHRPTHHFIESPQAGKILAERLVYGEKHPDLTRNLKERLFRHYDEAGFASHERYDFKGNILASVRQLAASYRSTPDWSVITNIVDTPALDLAGLDAATAPLLVTADLFTTSSRFDALDRPVQVVTPFALGGRPSVIQSVYNEANLLERIDVWLRHAAPPAALLAPESADMHAVTNIDYNAHGQRLEVALGNGSLTTSTYDPETFRLSTLTTTRPYPDPNMRTVQALAYTYDPTGNITCLRDLADLQDVIYFRNQRVEPSTDYTYDALYRLLLAKGREHLGQTGNALNPPQQITNDDSFRMGQPLPSDGNAMGTYTEQYVFDPVGNLQQMIHQVASGSWTRFYAYHEPSRITPAEASNRLSATSQPGDHASGPYSARYTYDAHGNMLSMPHLPALTWNEYDHLQSTTRQVVNSGTPETTYYAYDAEGQRIHKVTERQAGTGQTPMRKSERIYLGAIEIYREYGGDGTTISKERETLHVLLDSLRIAMVETLVSGTDPAPGQLTRYQYTNHLGSALLELDSQAGVISYEEYFPYGSSSYQAVRNTTETPKRYRYTGKERDEENDLYYHGARYYAPWLGRWTSCDPLGIEDGPNIYMYVHGNPVAFSDPTGMLSWRTIAIVAAVVVVGTVVTVATAGVAGPIVAGAVASVGLSGATATVATGVVVGAVAGAAGGAAGELTRQVASGEQISGRAIGRAALIGGALGAVTGGVSALASTARGAAAISRANTAVRASSVGRAGAAAARTVSAGARAVARVPGIRQAVGAARAIGGGAVRGAGRALSAIEHGGQNLGIRASQGIFTEGSAGAQAVSRFAATRDIAKTFGASPSQSARPLGGRGPIPRKPDEFGTHTGAASGRPFTPSEAGGPIRDLSTRGVRVTSRGIDVVERHLARFGSDPQNAASIQRLRDIAAGRTAATQADLNFYTHELREFVRYRNLGFPSGVPASEAQAHALWNNAHTAALEDYGLRQGVGVLYHPSTYPK
ncbi:MAG TPA: SpvB/TcaC N-terminal domain-containing protein [Ktedonobacteraceae bacterium]